MTQTEYNNLGKALMLFTAEARATIRETLFRRLNVKDYTEVMPLEFDLVHACLKAIVSNTIDKTAAPTAETEPTGHAEDTINGIDRR